MCNTRLFFKVRCATLDGQCNEVSLHATDEVSLHATDEQDDQDEVERLRKCLKMVLGQQGYN